MTGHYGTNEKQSYDKNVLIRIARMTAINVLLDLNALQDLNARNALNAQRLCKSTML